MENQRNPWHSGTANVLYIFVVRVLTNMQGCSVLKTCFKRCFKHRHFYVYNIRLILWLKSRNFGLNLMKTADKVEFSVQCDSSKMICAIDLEWKNSKNLPL